MSTTDRLSRATLSRVPEPSRPAVDPASLRPRLVHLGIGAFHRAHQAVYTEAAEAAHGGGWGIAGVTQRSRTVVDRLRPQDGLYSLARRELGGPAVQVVGSVVEVLHAVDDGHRLAALLASPDVAVVTITVTEKGYRWDPATGGLAVGDPLVRADLAGAPTPATVVGQLVAGLRARMRVGAPISVVSCDNMVGNGEITGRLVREYAAASGWPERDRLLDWIDSTVAFPSTVVDRIVPATTDADLRTAALALGLRDEGAVVGEPFSQWIVQDAFASDRPRWEAAGVTFVPDVRPYQMMKLRLLNGAHSLMAYLGLAAGCETVADVMDTPWGEPVVRAYTAEVAATLTGGLSSEAYTDALIERFANHAMRHRLRQIAADGSLKVPERWLAPLRELRAAGAQTPMLELALAAWARHTRDGEPDDPAAARLSQAWADRRGADAVRALLSVIGADDLAEDDSLTAAVAAHLADPPRLGSVP
ncbi:mannitol dehydrogenase family protein [Microbispora sp. SCL1-1]|uniref:mannitol dehydrogenase family protein n=1 Tax=unclassified Microbispora TaxID=2614687 RepID=UPI00115B87A9|nr:mannitol dehydrogenase family protein [Microbispora sp. SCL1-1]NJP29361.1 mannitol dehydrogenase family protein [Microbispora sp. CL1-1]TQS05440.1 mannitol dehydrogenase family protein [Microbispora sp. SCL1-1]